MLHCSDGAGAERVGEALAHCGRCRLAGFHMVERRDTRNQQRFHCRSEEHTSELQSLRHLVCRLLLEKKKTNFTLLAQRLQKRPIRLIRPRNQARTTCVRTFSAYISATRSGLCRSTPLVISRRLYT